VEPGNARGLVVVLFLLIVYGSLSVAKSAIINLRHVRLGQLLEEGRENAQLVSRLAEDSTRLLAAFQLWLALAGGLAVGVASLTLVSPLQSAFARARLLSGISTPLGAGIVLSRVSYSCAWGSGA
jgi:CBS domain containing-hemolysin-like protein